MSNADKIKTALEEIDTGLATINTNEDWIHFLSFQAQFYNYSFGNAMLIYLEFLHFHTQHPCLLILVINNFKKITKI